MPPACFTNPSGEKELPWQTQTMLTSVLVYLYNNPVTVFPFGPFPVVDTYGICDRDDGRKGFSFLSPSPSPSTPTPTWLGGCGLVGGGGLVPLMGAGGWVFFEPDSAVLNTCCLSSAAASSVP